MPSNVYTVFEVVDEKEFIPQYSMLWFSRPEFDRFARLSHTEVFEMKHSYKEDDVVYERKGRM